MDITEQLGYAESQLDRLTDEQDKLIEDYQFLERKLAAVEKVLGTWRAELSQHPDWCISAAWTQLEGDADDLEAALDPKP